MYNTITEQQAIRYEVGSLTLIGRFLFKYFTKYYLWRLRCRYKRYLGYVEYEKLQKEKEDRDLLLFMKFHPKNASNETNS